MIVIGILLFVTLFTLIIGQIKKADIILSPIMGIMFGFLYHKEQYEDKTYVSSDKILSALKKIGKMSNPRYREKVEFNKRNNLDYKGNPIAKNKD